MTTIALTNGGETVVDDADYARLSAFRWRGQVGGSTRYVVRHGRRNGKAIAIQMHREVLLVPKGFQVDHQNGDGLDNRRANLRQCTHAENLRNSRKHRRRVGHTGRRSQYKGVRFCGAIRRKNRWQARIRHSGIQESLGWFPDEATAAQAYDAAAKIKHGVFARLNFA